MSDLHDQLRAKFGASVESSPSKADGASDPLSDDALQDSSWVQMLLPLARQVGVKAPGRPSFEAAKQLHDRVGKQLKATGRNRERKALTDERSRYTKKREKTVWGRLKSILEEAGVSDRFYRSLKQGKVDPERDLQRANRVQSRLSGMSNAEVKAALLGQ